jgi:site-specific DNA-methyltransferase (adenine-specific)
VDANSKHIGKGNNMDIQDDGWKVLAGSCLDRLLELEDNSIDAVVTDPPYELGFMGKSWDSSGIAYNVEVWRQCLRVLKPGGHILAFGGSRTWHRLAVAVEDAGFELRDSIAWIYGSGFPKSLDVSKAIDKAAGAEREKVKHIPRPETSGTMMGSSESRPWIEKAREQGFYEADGPDAVTDDAKKWQGWGTALKPAFEPVVVGRKPLTGTVAANVLEWGVGGLNIDGTRIGTENIERGRAGRNTNGKDIFESGLSNQGFEPARGRWPSNVMLDEYTAGLVDQQSGDVKGKVGVKQLNQMQFTVAGDQTGKKYASQAGLGDSGGASRFFYVAKASKRDRNEGLDELVGQSSAGKGNGLGRVCEKCGASILKPCSCEDRTFVNPAVKNFHPTVKPTELMRNLIRLVTPLGGVVLDPFTGSGSTGKAAILEGMQFIGCELTPEYLPIIEGRINYAVSVKEQELLAEDEKLF